jgi:hypothetical protein
MTVSLDVVAAGPVGLEPADQAILLRTITLRVRIVIRAERNDGVFGFVAVKVSQATGPAGLEVLCHEHHLVDPCQTLPSHRQKEQGRWNT